MHYIDHKFIQLVSSYLSGWKPVGNNIYNFRCPFCGDSKKNKSKRRGYLYPVDTDIAYKCHNCGASQSLANFIREISPDLASQYRFERFVEPKKRTLEQRSPEIDFSVDVKARLKMTDKLLKRCMPLLDLEPDHPARKLIDGRKIPEDAQKGLYFVDDANIVLRSIARYSDRLYREKFSAIVIPFFDEQGTLTYLQLRGVDENSPIRYQTLEVEEGAMKIWGLDKIDWDKPIFVFEGPFDAMFIPNSVAAAGASSLIATGKYLEEKANDTIILVFDRDYMSNYQVYAQFKRAVADGLTVVMYDRQFNWNDANAAIEDGWSMQELEAYFKKQACSGLKAQLALSSFKPPTKKGPHVKKSPQQ